MLSAWASGLLQVPILRAPCVDSLCVEAYRIDIGFFLCHMCGRSGGS